MTNSRTLETTSQYQRTYTVVVLTIQLIASHPADLPSRFVALSLPAAHQEKGSHGCIYWSLQHTKTPAEPKLVLVQSTKIVVEYRHILWSSYLCLIIRLTTAGVRMQPYWERNPPAPRSAVRLPLYVEFTATTYSLPHTSCVSFQTFLLPRTGISCGSGRA